MGTGSVSIVLHKRRTARIDHQAVAPVRRRADASGSGIDEQLQSILSDSRMDAALPAKTPDLVIRVSGIAAYYFGAAMGEYRVARSVLLAPAELGRDWGVADRYRLSTPYHWPGNGRAVANVKAYAAKSIAPAEDRDDIRDIEKRASTR
jgi:hypothetical protein